MNGIAKNLVPNDVKLECEHVVTVEFKSNHGKTFMTCLLKIAEKIIGDAGIRHPYCCKCGARLEES